jgi:hypothetical protein
MKLHVSILTPATIKTLLIEGRDLVDVPMSKHTLDRIAEKSLRSEDVRTAILEGSLIGVTILMLVLGVCYFVTTPERVLC